MPTLRSNPASAGVTFPRDCRAGEPARILAADTTRRKPGPTRTSLKAEGAEAEGGDRSPPSPRCGGTQLRRTRAADGPGDPATSGALGWSRMTQPHWGLSLLPAGGRVPQSSQSHPRLARGSGAAKPRGSLVVRAPGVPRLLSPRPSSAGRSSAPPPVAGVRAERG